MNEDSEQEGKDMTARPHRATRLRRMLAALAEAFTNDTALWIGFATFWLWPWLLSFTLGQQSRLADGSLSPLGMYSRLSFFLFMGGTLLALALLYRFFKTAIPRATASYIACSTLTLSSCLMLASSQIDPHSTALMWSVVSLRSLLGGIGVAVLCIECGVAFGAVGAQRTLLCGIIATVVSSLLTKVFAGLPLLAPQIGLVVLSVSCLFSLPALLKAYPDSLIGETSKSDAPLPVNPVRVPWKLTITTVVWTLSFGAISAVFDFSSFWSEYGLVSYAAAAVVLFVCMIYLKMNFNNLIYKAGFLTVAAGLAVILFTRTLMPESYVLFVVGYRFIELLVWGLYAHLICTRGLSSYWTISLNVGIWTLGRYSGFFFASLLLNQSGEALSDTAFALVLAVELLLLVSALFLSNHNNFVEGWGMERVADRHRSERQIEHCCERLAAEHGLTPKEAEILIYVAKGMTRSEISEKLVVSPETTKTHIRHIYQKMNVNSRDKVLDLIDDEIALSNEY